MNMKSQCGVCACACVRVRFQLLNHMADLKTPIFILLMPMRFTCLRKIAKGTTSFVASVRLSIHMEKTSFLLHGLSRNLTLQKLSRTCGENSSFIKIGNE